MPQSPLDEQDGVLGISVTSDGVAIADTIALFQVDVRRAIGTVASAVIVVADGGMASGEWTVADSDMFAPGAEIIIKAGYAGNEAAIFAGIVVKISVRLSSNGTSQLHVHCQDPAVKMAMVRRNATYAGQTDAGIMAALCTAHGLTSDIDAADGVHHKRVQEDCSDWDFLLSLARANGLMLVTDGSTITAKPPNTSARAALGLTWGIDLLDFEAALDARSQLGMAAVSPGQRAKAETSGRMTFSGSAKALPATMIELGGVGERFSGAVFAGSISHEIRDGFWRTTAEYGSPARWLVDGPT